MLLTDDPIPLSNSLYALSESLQSPGRSGSVPQFTRSAGYIQKYKNNYTIVKPRLTEIYTSECRSVLCEFMPSWPCSKYLAKLFSSCLLLTFLVTYELARALADILYNKATCFFLSVTKVCTLLTSIGSILKMLQHIPIEVFFDQLAISSSV